MSVTTRSAEETEDLGARLGGLLLPGDFIALTGDLGAGKTRFVRGAARGLGVGPDIPITSPTYTLMNIYQGRFPLCHFDLYRLAGENDIDELGLEEYLFGQGVCMVEWAERMAGSLPDEMLTVSFLHGEDDVRTLDFVPRGDRYQELVQRLFPDRKKMV